MSIKKYVIIYYCLLFSHTVFSQIILEGVVRDNYGKPVEGVLVELVDSNISNSFKSITNAKGEYYIAINVTDANNNDIQPPDAFYLMQNYPNPFSSYTIIEWELTFPSFIRIEIYNILGQRIKTLFDGYHLNHNGFVVWDGTNEQGNQVCTGVYFYSLITDNCKINRKMLVIDKDQLNKGNYIDKNPAHNNANRNFRYRSVNHKFTLRVKGNDIIAFENPGFLLSTSKKYNINVFRPATGKIGGVCFRVDDNGIQHQKTEWSKIFDKYGFKASWAINSYGINAGIAGDFQRRGHELTDHTPNHNCDYGNLRVSSDRKYFINQPGVDSVSTKGRIYYERAFPDTANPLVQFSGKCRTIAGTNLIENVTGESIPNYVAAYIYVYNTSPKKKNKPGWYLYTGYYKKANNMVSTSLRGDIINFASTDTLKIYVVKNHFVSLTVAGQTQMMKTSIINFERAGLEPPNVWIQPGGSHPMIEPYILEQACRETGYLGGEGQGEILGGHGNYAKTYNSSYNNPFDYGRYTLWWGGLYMDQNYFKSQKTIIADEIAKHRILIDHNHFTSNLYSSINDYYVSFDSVLAFLYQNDIPVYTYSQMISILFDRETDPYINIIPPLNRDIDKNSRPDGYDLYQSAFYEKNDGLSKTTPYSISISKADTLFKIDNLFGIEKGENEFICWLKGEPGNQVKIILTPDIGKPVILQYTIQDTSWTYFTQNNSTLDTAIIFHPFCFKIDIYAICNKYTSGTVKITGMELRKKSQ